MDFQTIRANFKREDLVSEYENIMLAGAVEIADETSAETLASWAEDVEDAKSVLNTIFEGSDKDIKRILNNVSVEVRDDVTAFLEDKLEEIE